MPFFPETDEPPQTRTPTGRPLPNPVLPTGGEIIGASFRSLNPAVNLAARLSEEQYEYDPKHNPLDIIRGTKYDELYKDNFTTSANEKETRAIMQKIDEEESDAKIRQAGGFFGTVTDIAAGFVDPTLFMPVGTAAKAARGGYSLLKSGGALAGGFAAPVAIQEAVLMGTRETHTMGEAALAVGSGALLGGFLGGTVAAALTRGQSRALTRILDAERAKWSEHVEPGSTPIRPGDVSLDDLPGQVARLDRHIAEGTIPEWYRPEAAVAPEAGVVAREGAAVAPEAAVAARAKADAAISDEAIHGVVDPNRTLDEDALNALVRQVREDPRGAREALWDLEKTQQIEARKAQLSDLLEQQKAAPVKPVEVSGAETAARLTAERAAAGVFAGAEPMRRRGDANR